MFMRVYKIVVERGGRQIRGVVVKGSNTFVYIDGTGSQKYL